DTVGEIQGGLLDHASTDDPRPLLNGFGEPGGRVDIYDNGDFLGQATVTPERVWSFQPLTDLADGKHDLTISITDLAGNVSEMSRPHSIT
ncbi:Ig-like domain-containing protein, partial [Mucilaginibacter sp. 10I4]